VSSIAVVALDIHKDFSRAIVMDSNEGIVEDSKVSHADHSELEEFFRKFEPGTHVLMEATFNWPWIVDLAEECGLKPHLGDPMRIRDFRKSLPKSDRKDAIAEGHLWIKGMFPEVYIAPPEVRRMRALFRMRLLFVRMRTSLKNSIHGLLFKQGVTMKTGSELFASTARMILHKWALSEDAKVELARKLALLDDVFLHIDRLGLIIREELHNDPRADLIRSIPGIGDLTAYCVLAEMGTVERFANGRALAAYAGLLPLDNESADKNLGKKTGYHSNRYLKWAVLEGVNGAVRGGPKMRALYNRVKARNRKAPGKARVAVARKMLELVHLVLSRGVPFSKTPPPRPGSCPTRDKVA
jgi:transposase